MFVWHEKCGSVVLEVIFCLLLFFLWASWLEVTGRRPWGNQKRDLWMQSTLSLLVWEKRLQRMGFYGGRWFAATTSFFFLFFYSCWSIVSSSPTCCPQCWSLVVFFSLYFLVGTRVNWQKGKVYKDSSLTFMSICDSMFDLMVLYFQLGLLWKSPLKIA